MLSRQASGIIFFGHDADRSGGSDMSGKPVVVLSFVSFAFLALLVVVAYAQPEGIPISTLPTPPVFRSTSFDPATGDGSSSASSSSEDGYTGPSFDDYPAGGIGAGLNLDGIDEEEDDDGGEGGGWPTYVFAAVAVLAVLSFGFIAATTRASHLRKHGLLENSLARIFCIHKAFNAEKMLAATSTASLLCLGAFLYAATGSPLLLVVFVFFPPAAAFLGIAHAAWVLNDYEVVVWPPSKDSDKTQATEWGVVVPKPNPPPVENDPWFNGSSDQQQRQQQQQQQQQQGQGQGQGYDPQYGYD